MMSKDQLRAVPSNADRVKMLAMVAGMGAVLAAASFTVIHHDASVGGSTPPVGGGVVVAGGNHNKTFAPPSAPNMNMGGTVTETTPTDVLPVEKAEPAIRGAH
ncbi:hypothetical protein H7J51_09750 [Mycobacterium crocinum]|uniref:Uncharacterized protein n=1 Tax=Mycolicibacterium crocinum TaxID=388459 RepID=A0ABY3THN3_9MYCO|nr:hypothetical protein [Mycolicibacterium crocinum]MCV7215567.1 hypothetical protein [Mycolicibacterium crocinum]ULN39254.1 hypothetical protein MI149_15890 [Mycolicibacterium crocinum]